MINVANLKKRLGFAAFAVPIAIVVVNSKASLTEYLQWAMDIIGLGLPTMPHEIYPAHLLVLLLVMLGAQEYTKMLSIANPKNIFWLGRLWVFVTACAYLIGYSISATVLNATLLMIVAFDTFAFGKNAPQDRWKRASLFLTGMFFLNIAGISTMALFRHPVSTLFAPPDIFMLGRLDILGIITATFMSDTAAYLVGSAWGKRRLAPNISPNKSVEGSLGGLLASIVIMTVFWIFVGNHERFPMYIGVALGLVIGITAQAGDLLMSLVKRYFNVKDASNLIPGHGGILDRFDSLFLVATALYLFAMILTRLYA